MTKIIIGVVAVVVVAGGAWWWYTGNPLRTEFVPVSEQGGSLVQLAKRAPSTCTVSSEANGVTSSGTVYVADGQVRGDFISNVPQTGPVESHLVVRDGYVYTWSSAMPQGIKTKVEAAGGGEQNLYNTNYGYECTSSDVDASQFTLPSDVIFVEY